MPISWTARMELTILLGLSAMAVGPILLQDANDKYNYIEL